MATTVNSAFSEFMKNTVNLDADVVSAARKSRDNLLRNIEEFNSDNDFFTLYEGFNVHFGSFARKTKCRKLDDIDLMIGIAADGATYDSSNPWDDVKITASASNEAQLKCARDDGTLNSTKVVNRFKKKLEEVREYARSELHRNGEAVVLDLVSKDWSFDIVPCFHTVTEYDGRAYYLIPNGSGNWKKTDPNKDRDHVIATNQSKDGRVLELIRLIKRWNKTRNAKTMPSYLLETMIINHADSVDELSQWIDYRFRDALKYVADNVRLPVYDMKQIQGDINSLDFSERIILQVKAQSDYEKACLAWELEKNGNHKDAIKKWGEIFGGEFPVYG